MCGRIRKNKKLSAIRMSKFFLTSSQWKNILFKKLEMRKKWFAFDKNFQINKLKLKLTSTKLILPNFDDIFFL